ncbi:hypothetical protein FLJC2902T_12520 [Flavobacterium limnosediminis JC2902]|uniref:Lipocalin-like domain-containing protein n=1 Tax=Flavobacterium limnosediminis JC2902 TaxID=1341181 RepID=V6SPX8_9FLAO|nr:lipocalin family protein [Flavobacterium limnosediminis]ESU28661.1 hypothetical protein FLJC2902T_12520 [Flavobacterium limnosediminis JC2902]
MKKVSILFVSALALGMTFTSCNKDDGDNSSAPVASVEGKWNFNKFSVTQNGVTSPEDNYPNNQEGCSKDFIELKADGIYNEGDYVDSACTLEQTPGTWTKDNNSISLSVDGETQAFEIVSLSTTELKVKATFTEQGTTFTLNVSFTKA